MDLPHYHEALEAYVNPFHEFTVEPISGGLINHSYKVTSQLNGYSFLLQQINPHVFPEPLDIQDNYEMLWEHLQSGDIPFQIPEPKYFADDSTLFCDSRDNYWRVFEFIEDTNTYHIAQTVEQAEAVAGAFADLTASFREFDVNQLHITIPGFHDLSNRFNQFRESVEKGDPQRLSIVKEMTGELKKREGYVHFYDVLAESDEFPLRVMHHDSKISNILFDKESGEVICPVDLDTVMPGYFFSDLGDMIRSMACCKDENSTDFDELCIRKDFYNSIINSYLEIVGDQLTGSEKKYIHYAGLLMIYMQALRFITDYLNGDVYYHIQYPQQNADRAKNQLILLKSLEKFLEEEYNFKV